MVIGKDIQPVLVALESIDIKGQQNIGTMNNIFNYLIQLQQRLDVEAAAAQESETDKDADKLQD